MNNSDQDFCVYYLYADLDSTYKENFAESEAEAKRILLKWITTGGIFAPTRIDQIKVLKITRDLATKGSCNDRLSQGKPVNVSLDVVFN